jgi:hypothetical protein
LAVLAQASVDALLQVSELGEAHLHEHRLHQLRLSLVE